MGRNLTTTEETELEHLLDSCGMCAILQALSSLCNQKADHIRVSYDDWRLAKAWNSAGGYLGVASANKYITRIGEP